MDIIFLMKLMLSFGIELTHVSFRTSNSAKEQKKKEQKAEKKAAVEKKKRDKIAAEKQKKERVSSYHCL